MPFDEIALRRATLDDTLALATIGSATFLESFAGVLEGSSILQHCQRQHSIETYATYLAHPGTLAWLAVVQPGDAPVGYAMLTAPDLPLDDITEKDIELKRIYIFSRFQGRGAGSMLMRQAVESARAAGKSRLLLGVYGNNHSAIAYYTKHGFRQVGVRRFQIGTSTYDDLILARPL